MTEIERVVLELATRARAASRTLARLPGETRRRAVEAMADALEGAVPEIVEANALDVAAAGERGLSSAMVDRLRLDEGRIAAMAKGLREVAALPDPVGEVAESWERPNGLLVQRVRIPLGVVAMIYESRPNVTADAGGLCVFSGNAAILRGGSDAAHSNRAIAAVLRRALEGAGVPADALQLVDTTDRQAVHDLVQLDELIDLVIPRGGEALIRAVTAVSRVPVLKHYKGVCHVFVDESAGTGKASDIVFNAKVQRPGVCNALETLLVHEGAAERVLPPLAERLRAAGVRLFGCERTREILGEEAVAPATEEDWHAEYLDLRLAVRVVPDMEAAIRHIETYGSQHTEAIVTEDAARGREFVGAVQSSTVLVNASTRFADGGQLGLGAEIGISTSKLHAFGPMGARELTTTKFVVFGEGQVRE